VGQYIIKCKKSTVLKATEICYKLFEELEADKLLIPSDKPKQAIVEKVDNSHKEREEYEEFIFSL